jgi:hypothetical protein
MTPGSHYLAAPPIIKPSSQTKKHAYIDKFGIPEAGKERKSNGFKNIIFRSAFVAACC